MSATALPLRPLSILQKYRTSMRWPQHGGIRTAPRAYSIL